jgi:hypothetical protein
MPHHFFLPWTSHQIYQHLSKQNFQILTQLYFMKVYFHITTYLYQMKVFAKVTNTFLYINQKEIRQEIFHKIYTRIIKC